jgi:hypothetical protein
MKTAVVEGRVDVKDLATCADYFIKQNLAADTKSDLVYKIITTFAHACVKQGATEFASSEAALGYLFNAGLGPVNRIKHKDGRRANNFTLSKAIASERQCEEIDLTDLAQQAMEIMNKKGGDKE